jgi:S-(hydroxymethyl)glutathione dehydrogenase / alcohol dehydrogenase
LQKSGKDSETNLPCILGHEGIGVVESVGEGVTDVAVGDTVIPLYTPECRECLFCKATGAKRNNLCAKIRATQGKGLMPDGTTRFSIVKDGVTTPVFHFMGVSSFSEYCVCAAISLAKVPSTIDPERGCLFGCGLVSYRRK